MFKKIIRIVFIKIESYFIRRRLKKILPYKKINKIIEKNIKVGLKMEGQPWESSGCYTAPSFNKENQCLKK